MSELLLELFSEEIPARMQVQAAKGYRDIFTAFLAKQEISFSDLLIEVGPRRVVICISGLPPMQQSSISEIKGPKIFAPETAVNGFCQSNKITKDQLVVKDIKGIEYFFYIKQNDEKEIAELFRAELPSLISSYVWPKSMRWGDYGIKWVRPLQNILCILDGAIIDFKYGHLTANNVSRGHRFLAGEEFSVSNFQQYKQKLQDNFVIFSFEEKKHYIQQEISKICTKLDLNLQKDEALLEEVCGLAEFPEVLIGQIEQKFLTVPSEIPVSAMRAHQKYFALFDKNGNFAPYFIFVSNIVSSSPSVVIKGNEKVLSARLADALYFYNQDLKIGMDARLEKLDKVIFHAKLGTLKEKVLRLQKIVEFLEPRNSDLSSAALLCKNDIVSEVVGEFPELQGIMGYYYAKERGESEDFCLCIRDHYKPQGPSDYCPSGAAALLALADKTDTLCGLIIAGEKPTGSKDPYALRRQAIGIVRIILENNLEIDINLLVNCSLQQYESSTPILHKTVIDFLEDRLKYFWKDDFRKEAIAAVINLEKDPGIVQTKLKIEALTKFLSNPQVENLLSVYRRSANIIQSANFSEFREDLLEHNSEIKLYNAIKSCNLALEKTLQQRDYLGSLVILADLGPPLENFFENVMVKTDNKKVADNRLALLSMITDIFHRLADFNKL